MSLRAKRALLATAVATGVLLTWALLWDRTDWLASPAAVWEQLVATLEEPSTYADLLATSRRLFFGLLIGYGGAVLVSLLVRQSRWWKMFVGPYVLVLLATPSIALALISLMVFGLSDLGVYLAVAGVVFPLIVISLLEGLENLDRGLSDMTIVYRFSGYDRSRHQALPEMAPYLFAAFRNVHALAWKLVVTAELFSTQDGVGFQYKRAFAFFETDRLIVWSIFFVTMVMIVEYGLLRPFERVVFRWRA